MPTGSLLINLQCTVTVYLLLLQYPFNYRSKNMVLILNLVTFIYTKFSTITIYSCSILSKHTKFTKTYVIKNYTLYNFEILLYNFKDEASQGSVLGVGRPRATVVVPVSVHLRDRGNPLTKTFLCGVHVTARCLTFH